MAARVYNQFLDPAPLLAASVTSALNAPVCFFRVRFMSSRAAIAF
jgi:hypothetical protein